MKKVSFKNISIVGAKTHNLQNVSLDIPLNKITCISGPSGSGKSSLAFHTLLAESKRRYLNSLPNDVKFFWNMPTAADVDSIHPVLPVWGLSQINPILGSRPNLADTLGLSEYLQRLWYDFGVNSCPEHRVPLVPIQWEQTFLRYLEEASLDYENDVFHFLVERGLYRDALGRDSFPNRSFSFEKSEVQNFVEEDLYWEVFRLKPKDISKILSKVKELKIPKDKILFTLKNAGGLYPLPHVEGLTCPKCDYQVEDRQFEPTEFSPYNAGGACKSCNGHGMNLEYDREKVVKYPYLSIPEGAISILESSHFSYLYPYLEKELKKAKISLEKPFNELPQKKLWKILEEGSGKFPGLKTCYDYLDSKRYKRTVRIFSRKLKSERLCEVCEGTRVGEQVHNFLLPDCKEKNFKEIWQCHGEELLETLEKWEKVTKAKDLKKRLGPILNLLQVCQKLGLDHIPLWRKSKYLSSSEYQRALLNKILSYEGSGSLFVLDEPSFDLGLEEQKEVFECLESIRDQGNTVLLVEHSEYLKNCSDYLVEMGPGAGPRGGQIIGKRWNKRKKRAVPKIKAKKISSPKKVIKVKKYQWEGKNFDSMSLPLNKTTVVYGDSGSYKDHYFHKFFIDTVSYLSLGEPIESMANVRDELISGVPEFEKVLLFDSNLGRVSSRSTVGTTIGLSPELRKYFASLPISKEFALEKGHFSPNSDLGRCPTCEGKGIKEVEMSFLEDITLVCDDCNGKQLKPFIADISDGEFTVHEAYQRPMEDVIPKLKLTPKFKKLWSLVELLNLSYLSLGRPLSSLSGGERLRIKLLSQLTTKLENSLLVFDNISSGLSPKEVEKLFDFLDSLKHVGNTILVIDQNPLLIQRAENTIRQS